jgi:uncharacterized protein (TIGR03435 family)
MRRLPVLLAFAVAPAFPQASFLAASVKPGDPSPGAGPMILVDPGRVQYSNVTLRTLLTRAYALKDYQVKGPDWLGTLRYTLIATTPPGTSDATVAEMLRALLAERFELKLRRTQEEMPVYALTVGKGGPKLAKGDGGALSVRSGAGVLRGKNLSMWNLANLLGALVDRPVLDLTGVEGVYDLSLEFAPDTALGPGMSKLSAEAAASGRPLDAAPGPSIFTAVQQLGLKLDARKAPVEILVVESASRVPVKN